MDEERFRRIELSGWRARLAGAAAVTVVLLAGIAAAGILATFAVFALIFAVGAATVAGIGWVALRLAGGPRRRRPAPPGVIDADYVVIEDAARR